MSQRIKVTTGTLLCALLIVSGCAKMPTSGNVVDTAPASQVVRTDSATGWDASATTTTEESDSTTQRGGVLIGSGH